MKKAANVRLTLVSTAAAALVASGCGPPAASPEASGDPCAPTTFQDVDCREAVGHDGYYRHGVFVAHHYYRTYNDYRYDYDELSRQKDEARSAGSGGEVGAHAIAGESDPVSRGGFGETGEAGRAGGGFGE
jgi:hypothetical protein